jgi:hypothetical protein
MSSGISGIHGASLNPSGYAFFKCVTDSPNAIAISWIGQKLPLPYWGILRTMYGIVNEDFAYFYTGENRMIFFIVNALIPDAQIYLGRPRTDDEPTISA